MFSGRVVGLHDLAVNVSVDERTLAAEAQHIDGEQRRQAPAQLSLSFARSRPAACHGRLASDPLRKRWARRLSPKTGKKRTRQEVFF